MDGESGDGDGDDFTHMNSLTGLHEARSYCIVLYCKSLQIHTVVM